MYVMNKMYKKPLFWLVFLMLVIPILPSGNNVYRDSIKTVSKHLDLPIDKMSLISARSTHFLIFDTVSVELNVVIAKKAQVIKAKLSKLSFQKEYLIKSISKL